MRGQTQEDWFRFCEDPSKVFEAEIQSDPKHQEAQTNVEKDHLPLVKIYYYLIDFLHEPAKNNTCQDFSSMKILIVPDSFKGSASSLEVAHAIRDGVKAATPDAICEVRPLADGGEGSLDAIHQVIGGNWVEMKAVDPLQRPISAKYLRKEVEAYVELAEASGLNRLSKEEKDARITTTYGTGLQIQHALDGGCRKIYLFVGGSATNDAGLGIAHALGFRFCDRDDKDFLPTGNTLIAIHKIVAPPRVQNIEFTILCDVQNPFTGPRGATHIYGPQKGLDMDSVSNIEKGMEHLRHLFKTHFEIDLNRVKGSGAAGGSAGGMVALLDAKILSGIKFVTDLLGLEDAIAHADLIITGEGKLDQQTAEGKAIGGVVSIARKYSKPVIAICGQVLLDGDAIQKMGLTAAFSIQRSIRSIDESIKSTLDDLRETSRQILNTSTFS